QNLEAAPPMACAEQEVQASGQQDLPRTLWVGDVEPWMDERYLSSCFEGTGEVKNIKISRRVTGRSCAFLEFARHEDGAALLASTGGPFRCAQGHSFRLNWA
ncbi:RBP45, partial [Symbiodinium natans]